MTDQSSTGPEGVDAELGPDGLGTGGFGDDGLGTDLDGDAPGAAADRMDEATPGGTTSDAADGRTANDGNDPGAGRHGPMVDDASIDWSAIEGSGAEGSGSAPGIPTDAEPADGPAPAS